MIKKVLMLVLLISVSGCGFLPSTALELKEKGIKHSYNVDLPSEIVYRALLEEFKALPSAAQIQSEYYSDTRAGSITMVLAEVSWVPLHVEVEANKSRVDYSKVLIFNSNCYGPKKYALRLEKCLQKLPGGLK